MSSIQNSVKNCSLFVDTEDWLLLQGLIPSTYLAAHKSVTPVPRDPMSSSDLCKRYKMQDAGDANENCPLVPDVLYLLMQFVMASKVEKTHALPPCYSTESLVSSLGLGIFCLVADRLLRFSIIQQNDWLRALSDNLVHGVIGMWSWAVVIGLRKKSDFAEVLLAGFLASVIDVDHFFMARSLSLQAALTLPRRPFLHCSTVIPITVLSVKVAVHLFKLRDWWPCLPWMIFISWTSHHIRDGIRHGLWICPFGKTPPLPFWLYVISTLSLPHTCSFLMYLTGTRETTASKHGMRIDV